MRWRRPHSLSIYWDEQGLVVENYYTRQAFSADPAAVPFLHHFSQWRSAEEIPQLDPDYSLREAKASIRAYARLGLLLREGSLEAQRDDALHHAWRDWMPHGSFHFATKDTLFPTVKRAEKENRALAETSEAPAKYKSYPEALQVALPPVVAPDARVRGGHKPDFPSVLLARRTHRRFAARKLTIDQVSKLLYYTWGFTSTVHSPAFGPLPAKTSPSGGSRHPVEVYMLALRVNGIPRGLYHYNARDHQLALLRRGDFSARATDYCAGQHWVGEAGAVFLMTAVFPRSMWKYRFPRAYRVVLLDAGHLGQTFSLVATWLGLAPFSTAALKDTRIENDLGIDGINESALFVTAAGVPARSSARGGGPTAFARPRK